MGVLTPNLTDELPTGACITDDVEEVGRDYGTDWDRFQDGKSQSWRTASVTLRTWQINILCITQADHDAVMLFIDDRAGGLEVMYWDHPKTNEQDIKVRIASGQEARSSWRGAAVSVPLRLEEVR